MIGAVTATERTDPMINNALRLIPSLQYKKKISEENYWQSTRNSIGGSEFVTAEALIGDVVRPVLPFKMELRPSGAISFDSDLLLFDMTSQFGYLFSSAQLSTT